jgi:CRP-like cAMP-binding protein
MAKNDSDLFDRLRQAGLRKQVAKTLSEIGEGASKRAVRAARSAVSELRSVAEEIERRLPSATPKESATAKTAGRTTTRRSPATTARASRSRPAGANTGGSAQRPVTQRKRDAAPRPKTAAAPTASGARAPRGQNKAKILESLKAGPKTAAEIAKETGIGTGTVSATLTKLATAGEVVKADRGYGLPK